MNNLEGFLADLITPIIERAINAKLSNLDTVTTPLAKDDTPYGDFNWLRAVCVGTPESTLRVKSSKGEIPGVIKFGKRVLYEKRTVLDWLKSKEVKKVQHRKIQEAAQEQFDQQHTTRKARRSTNQESVH